MTYGRPDCPFCRNEINTVTVTWFGRRAKVTVWDHENGDRHWIVDSPAGGVLSNDIKTEEVRWEQTQ